MPCVLIVEDNATALKMFRLTLEAEGYSVLEALCANDALAELGRSTPDLVLQDLVLPDMDGVVLARLIRAIPKCAEIPILGMSGFPRLLERASAEDACFDASLVKPIAPAFLIETVRRFLPPASAGEVFGRSKTLLLVDDDPVQLKLSKLHFAHAGFDVVTAADGAAALVQAQTRHVDVVVCDVLMPGTDGYELCLALRRLPALRNVPVVLVSAHYGGQRDEELARSVGASALVTRTSDPVGLLEAVRAGLSGGPASSTLSPELRRQEHSERVIAQLKRQARANAGMAERSALQTAQLSILAGVADALTRSKDVEAAFSDVLAACLDAGGISRGALYRMGAGDRLVPTHALGFPDGAMKDLEVAFGHPELLERVASGTLVSPSAHLSMDEANEFLSRAGVRSAVMVPLADGDRRCIGALLLGTSVAEISDHDLIAFGRAIGAHIAQALSLAAVFGRMQESEQRHRFLTDLIPVQVWSSTPDGALDYVNQTALDYFGKSFDQVIRAGWQDVVHREDLEGCVERWTHSLVTGEPYEFEFRLLRGLDQTYRWHMSRASAFRSPSGEIVKWFGTNTDISGHKQHLRESERLIDALERSNSDLEQFVSAASHDLKTPLRGIFTLSEWITEDSAHRMTQASQEHLALLRGRAHRMDALIQGILSYSQAGKMREPAESIDVGELLKGVIVGLAPGETVKIVVAPGMPTLVTSRAPLAQMFSNLISNAIKHSGRPDVEIRVDVAGVGQYREFSVSDNGKGIAPEYHDRIWNLFQTLETRDTVEGSGIGLSVIKKIAEARGGRAWVESVPGKGATFHFLWPERDDTDFY